MKIEHAKVYNVNGYNDNLTVGEIDAIVVTLDDGRRVWMHQDGVGSVTSLDAVDSDTYSIRAAAEAARKKEIRKVHAERSRKLHRNVADLKRQLLLAERALKAHKAAKPRK